MRPPLSRQHRRRGSDDSDSDSGSRPARRRHEPAVLSGDEATGAKETAEEEGRARRPGRGEGNEAKKSPSSILRDVYALLSTPGASSSSSSSDSDGDDSDMDEEAIGRRRELMRQRALAKAQIGLGQEEVMAKEEEREGESEDSSEEEETTDESEEEEDARLKPVFVRKKVTKRKTQRLLS